MDSWEWCRTVYIASMLQVLRLQASKGGDSRFATIYSGRISLCRRQVLLGLRHDLRCTIGRVYKKEEGKM